LAQAMSNVLFGTDGVRGTPGTFPLDQGTVFRLGFALTRQFGSKARFVIGRDTRQSGEMLEQQVASGVKAAGGSLVSVGVCPTPGVAFLAARSFSAGIVISASHNPFTDNGIKLLTATGEKASRRLESDIETSVALAKDRDVPRDFEVPVTSLALSDRYIEHLTKTMAGLPPFEPFRIAVDCANGATSRVAPLVFRHLGIPVVELNTSPDGKNINLGCGSTHPESLRRAVVDKGCRLGFAFDGDGDRVILVDDRGNVIDGDGVLLICARYFHSLGRLTSSAIVTTIMSNMGLELALRAEGISTHRCPVGDLNVLEEMRRRDVCLGGEQSGHVIFSDLLQTGDGIATALQIFRIVIESGRELSELVTGFETFPQKIVNVRVSRKYELDSIPEIRDLIDKAKVQLAGRGRVVVRFSGTEPLLRIMVEGPDMEMIQELASTIGESANRYLA